MRLFVATFAAGAIAGALAIGVAAIPERAAGAGRSVVRSPGDLDRRRDDPRPDRGDPRTLRHRGARRSGFLELRGVAQGTIINPRGLRLAIGMTVTIVGFNAGASSARSRSTHPIHMTNPERRNLRYVRLRLRLRLRMASAYGLGLGFFGAFGGQAVQPVAPVASPTPGVTRGIEHPTPAIRYGNPLDDQGRSRPRARRPVQHRACRPALHRA